MGRRPASANLTLDGDDILDDNVEVILERSPGKKVKKEKERKRKSRNDVDAEFKHALARMNADRNTFMVERREFYSKQERDRNEQLALEKKKFEAKIMKLNLDGMKPKQQLYFQRLQDEIFDALMSKSAITSPSEDPSTPLRGV
ncbi:uncharacterized protein LOC118348067 [Juglans regia]|uniref:Uncharacterized protein LOC118348067 n=2 Tax=Juglans regia TaxID=51240 RepID=A0A6P9EC21_JUGRE|nr:uncharacterized protein LOC118348067 [Juglans regia]